MNFLLGCYIDAMEHGEDHAMFVVYNDIDPALAEKLRADYAKWKADNSPPSAPLNGLSGGDGETK